jgi:hypothetical protein
VNKTGNVVAQKTPVVGKWQLVAQGGIPSPANDDNGNTSSGNNNGNTSSTSQKAIYISMAVVAVVLFLIAIMSSRPKRGSR